MATKTECDICTRDVKGHHFTIVASDTMGEFGEGTIWSLDVCAGCIREISDKDVADIPSNRYYMDQAKELHDKDCAIGAKKVNKKK